ncbi:MAG: HU family DNA-binding protein [Lachnospiraceae bacterium]|nr:HU family DNA-binding protein [Lachnospiraceae bacterium]
MNKKEFIEEISKRCQMTTYAVEELYTVSSGLVAERLIAGEEIELPQFGKFVLKEKYARHLLSGQGSMAECLCIYPAFQIAYGLKTRVKNGCKYPKAAACPKREALKCYTKVVTGVANEI